MGSTTQETGTVQRHMDMGFMYGKMGINTWGNGINVSSKASVTTTLEMEMNMKGLILRESFMGEANSYGKMG